MGEFTRYRVRVGTQSLSVDQPHYAGLSKFASGGAVNLGLEPSQMRLFAV
jgi:iron(III) transport system ATP-binding protein